MATAPTMTAPESSLALRGYGGDPARETVETAGALRGTAVSMSVDGLTPMERHPAWHMLSRLPVVLEAAIPLARFRVRDLVGLRPGRMVETAWPATSDIPLRCGSAQLSWAEFEVVDEQLAVRLTLLG